MTADSLATPAVCSQQQAFVFNLAAGEPAKIKNSDTPQTFELTVMTDVSQCAINTHMAEPHEYEGSTHAHLLFYVVGGDYPLMSRFYTKLIIFSTSYSFIFIDYI